MPDDRCKLTVLGGGSWGTALAMVAARNGTSTVLWSRESDEVEKMKHHRYNERYLGKIIFPELLTITNDLAQAMKYAKDVMIAVPSHAFKSVLYQIKPMLQQHRLVWATKGLDPDTDQFPNQMIDDIFKQSPPMAVLSGPSFAKEVASELPTAVVLATTHDNFAETLLSIFHSRLFRVYRSFDITGVQIGGTVKNVMAIATGISDGLKCGANARAALITRGLAEMRRFGQALGAEDSTFSGLAGLGDLVLTCTDDQSRNRRFGKAIGSNVSQEQALRDIDQVVEGAKNAAQVHRLASLHKVDMPITEMVHAILHQGMSPQQAEEFLLTRMAKEES